uniref:Thioesterase n=1 Tax=Desulfobacca acetoxidans TaxID=60893 RepID=A0A7C3Z028_9BACT
MPALKPGMVHEEEMVVEERHTARHLRGEGVKVLATPVMVGLMEAAARNLADPNLEPGHMTVGTDLTVKHLAPTPLGMRVRARAELVSVQGRWLTFKIEVFDAREKVGEATHTRAIVNLRKFWDKLRTKTEIGLA